MADVLSITRMNVEFLKHKKRTKVERRKNRGYEPIWDIIHIYMEISQGNSLCSYLEENCHFFSFTKLEDKRAEQVLLGGLVPVGGLWRWGKSVEG
jgi:hypothetical protein